MEIVDSIVKNELQQFATAGRYIEAPSGLNLLHDPAKSIFLGGGISNCVDWQSFAALSLLKSTNLRVINPRRFEYDNNDSTQAEVQITWEHMFLKSATELIFWFPSTSICPITLFEYGKWLGKKKIYIGCDPGYARKLDLEIQTKLELGSVHIYISICDLITAVVQDENENNI